MDTHVCSDALPCLYLTVKGRDAFLHLPRIAMFLPLLMLPKIKREVYKEMDLKGLDQGKMVEPEMRIEDDILSSLKDPPI